MKKTFHNCPRCQEKRIGIPIYKCQKCQTVHCFLCANTPGQCPECGHEDVKFLGEIKQN